MLNLTSDEIEQAAQVLAEARRSRYAIDTLPIACRPQSVSEGYLIQDALAKELGYEIGGWFCACTNVEVQRKLGLDEPYSARLFKQDIFRSPVNFSAEHFPSVIVMECEFAFRLGQNLKPRAWPYERAEVADAVAALHPSIEIVSGHFVDWLNMGIAHTIADNGTDGALAYGPGIALVWLVNAVSQRGHELKAGGFYNTGTATSMQVAELGDRVIANFQGLGSVEVNLGG